MNECKWLNKSSKSNNNERVLNYYYKTGVSQGSLIFLKLKIFIIRKEGRHYSHLGLFLLVNLFSFTTIVGDYQQGEKSVVEVKRRQSGDSRCSSFFRLFLGTFNHYYDLIVPSYYKQVTTSHMNKVVEKKK